MAVIGTFGSFTAARLGIYASQSSLNVTGNNIANINTKGYTRQRADLVSLYSDGNIRYANGFNLNIGYGVLVDGISQLRDPFLDIRYRNENSGLGANEAKLDCLNQLAHILDEVGKGNNEFGIMEDQFNDLLTQLETFNSKANVDVYDTPFTDVNDDEGIQTDAAYAKALGFTGKASISPRHVEVINQVFSPTQKEIDYAYEVMDAIRLAKEQGRGAIALRGKMIDAPIVARAEQTIAAAKEMGLGREEQA